MVENDVHVWGGCEQWAHLWLKNACRWRPPDPSTRPSSGRSTELFIAALVVLTLISGGRLRKHTLRFMSSDCCFIPRTVSFILRSQGDTHWYPHTGKDTLVQTHTGTHTHWERHTGTHTHWFRHTLGLTLLLDNS